MQRRKRFKAPVLSRLTWAWLGSLVLFAGAVSLFIYSERHGDGPGRIALPIDGIEIFARHQPPAPGTEERIVAPALREAEAPGMEGEDGLVLIYPDENDLYAESETDPLYDDEEDYSTDGVVITIAGGKPATSVSAASLTPIVRSIPDPDPALLQAFCSLCKTRCASSCKKRTSSSSTSCGKRRKA